MFKFLKRKKADEIDLKESRKTMCGPISNNGVLDKSDISEQIKKNQEENKKAQDYTWWLATRGYRRS